MVLKSVPAHADKNLCSRMLCELELNHNVLMRMCCDAALCRAIDYHLAFMIVLRDLSSIRWHLCRDITGANFIDDVRVHMYGATVSMRCMGMLQKILG